VVEVAACTRMASRNLFRSLALTFTHFFPINLTTTNVLFLGLNEFEGINLKTNCRQGWGLNRLETVFLFNYYYLKKITSYFD
jgi:hypothetical protein